MAMRVANCSMSEEIQDCWDEIVRIHKVGGWYITGEEKLTLQGVLHFRIPPEEIPCRVTKTCAYFCRHLEPTLEDHIMCRSSFGLTKSDMEAIESGYRRDNPDHTPYVLRFLEEVIAKSEVRD